VGLFRTIDAHTVSLSRTPRERVVLLVVPPEATTAAAATAMATEGNDSARPADILAASGIVAEDSAHMPPPRRPEGHPWLGVGAPVSPRRVPRLVGLADADRARRASAQTNGALSQRHQSGASGD